MNINPVGSNQTEVIKADGTVILFSYQTPVAVFVPGSAARVTETHYSPTTSRHISAALKRWNAPRLPVPQSVIDRIAA